MNYNLMDYVGDPSIISKTIQTATTKADNMQGQAALRMLNKRHFKNFKNQLNIRKG